MDQYTKAFLEERFASMDRRFGELPTKADVEKIVGQQVEHLAEMVHAVWSEVPAVSSSSR